MRGVKLETIRLALGFAYWQPILILFGGFAFDLRGLPALALIAASLVIAIAGGIAAWVLSLIALCPNCGGRYFSIVPLFFYTRRRCAQCGLNEEDGAHSRGGRS